MAGMLVSGAQTIFAGIAFAGAGEAMRLIEPNAFAEESKRHNRAMEKLSLAREKWQEKKIEEKNEMAHQEKRLSDANVEINQTNRELDNLRKVVSNDRKRGAHISKAGKEPRLSDFYKPSEKMETYRTGVVGAASMVGGAVLSQVVSKAF